MIAMRTTLRHAYIRTLDNDLCISKMHVCDCDTIILQRTSIARHYRSEAM